MQGEKFTLMQYNISAILGFIEAGDFVIPEIQRPFVWKRAQVRDLIDSLYNGYPTGYIITWKNPDVHTKDGTVANGKRVLIDGQQRITALMAAVSGLEVLDEDFNRDRIKIAFNPLAKDSDKRFAVQDASHLKDKKWIPDIAEVFKTEFDPFDFAIMYCNDNPDVKPKEINNAIMNLKGITNRQIGVIELDHMLDIDEVTEIFIRINSKGTALSQSDFVMSKMAADTIHGGNTLRKDVILELRTKRGLSQDDLAEKVMVTRQAVSRWENGETVPNTDTLKLLSKEFDVSINTLLGEPRKLICQCCGMPLEDDAIMGRDSDGSLNEDYCKWCYADGTYTYSNMDDLIDVCVKNMVGENFTEEQARAYLKEILPKLDYWKRYEQLSDGGQFEAFKEQLIDEINALHIEGMPHLERLNALVGKYVNLEYRLPNGMNVKFLDDEKTYLGNQLECEFGGDRCFGVLADMDFILISTYEAEGTNPELVLYKKR